MNRDEITDALRKKMILLEKYKTGWDGQHHHYEMNDPNKYDLYLGTNNKRPGPPLEESNMERDTLFMRKDKYSHMKQEGFRYSSPRVNLSINDWRKMISIV
jgi:hypothetical protein